MPIAIPQALDIDQMHLSTIKHRHGIAGPKRGQAVYIAHQIRVDFCQSKRPLHYHILFPYSLFQHFPYALVKSRAKGRQFIRVDSKAGRHRMPTKIQQ